MEFKFVPLIESLQKKIISVATQEEEPRAAILLEDKTIFFLDTEKGQILLPKPKEEQDGGGQLDENREGDVSEELQSDASDDEQGETSSENSPGEV